MIIIAAGILLFAGLGALGWFAVRAVNHFLDPEADEKTFEVDSAKIEEWTAAAAGHDSKKAKEEEFLKNEAYAGLKALKEKIEGKEERRMYVLAHLADLESYRKFSAMRWAREHMDKDEITDVLELSDHMLKAYNGIRQEMDRLCVEALDCPDEDVRTACDGLAHRILNILSVDLCVGYECPPENGKSYHNIQKLTRNDLRLIAGLGPEGDRGVNENPLRRHEFLWQNGYRCRRCGGSALTNADLKICDVPGGQEALCQNCRLDTY